MTDIEQRALELWGPGIAAEVNIHNFAILGSAFLEMRERHEAYKQKVSDAAERAVEVIDIWSGDRDGSDFLQPFIIFKPKPDPLVDVFDECFNQVVLEGETWSESMARKTRAALEARNLKIVEVNEDD
jgi:hypothetical protein